MQNLSAIITKYGMTSAGIVLITSLRQIIQTNLATKYPLAEYLKSFEKKIEKFFPV